MDQVFDEAFWNQMYQNRHTPWDAEPNPILAETVEDLGPGMALDVGCGEGSDAVWLANRGWQVTAVDLSSVALDRGRAADVDHLVHWVQADLLAWQPPADTFDLVSSHFLHFPPAERPLLFARFAQAVRQGGTLLFVSHHHSDLHTTIGRWQIPDLYFTAEDIAATLDPDRWQILICGTRPRVVTDREGRTVTIHDTILKARRVE